MRASSGSSLGRAGRFLASTSVAAALIFAGRAWAFSGFNAPLTGATPFVTGSWCSPTGIAFDNTHSYVVNFCPSTLYRFPVTGGDISSPEASNANGLTHGLAISNGHYYGLVSSQGVCSFDPSTLNRTLLATIPLPQDLAVDPLTGDLYVSSFGSGIFRVQNPDGGSPIVTHFVSSGTFDGIVMTADGSRIYVAAYSIQHVIGYDRSANVVLDVNLSPHGPDGLAVATGNTMISNIDVSNNVFVNSNDGTVERIDVNNGNAVTVVASGGSRGDLAKAGPDGCFYVTQSDHAEKLIPCFFQHATPARTSTWGKLKAMYR